MFEEERKAEQGHTFQKCGEWSGFLVSFFLSTTMIFFIFTWTKKIPASWSYFHIVGILSILLSIGWYLHKE